MNDPIASAGPMFALFGRIRTAEPTTAANQRTINSDTGAIRDIPKFKVNNKAIKLSTIEQTTPNKHLLIVLSTP